jgi:hypothetical protein
MEIDPLCFRSVIVGLPNVFREFFSVMIAGRKTFVVLDDIVIGIEIIRVSPHLNNIIVLEGMSGFVSPIMTGEFYIGVNECEVLGSGIVLHDLPDHKILRPFLVPHLRRCTELKMPRITRISDR